MDPYTGALLGALVAMFGWGIADLIAKKGIDQAGHYKAVLYISLFALLFSIPLLVFDTSLPTITTSFVAALFVFAIADFVAYFSIYKAYSLGKVSVLSPITSSYAVLATVVSILFFGEPYSIVKILSILVVVLGIILTAVDFKDLKDGFSRKDLAKGVPYAVLVFIIYGVYIPFWDLFVQDQNWILLSMIIKFLAVIFMVGFLLFKKVSLKAPKRSINKLFLIVGLLEAIAVLGFNYSITISDNTSLTAAITSAYPLPLVVLSYIFLKEKLSLNQYLGVALIVLGIFAMFLL